jgi:hypothetical protein
MENHSKYGEAIYFHNNKDVLVNLFIASELTWAAPGLKLAMETRFPGDDHIVLKVKDAGWFTGQIYLRYPTWVRRPVRIAINGRDIPVAQKPGELIRLCADWKTGDLVDIDMPQDFRLEPARDDPNMVAIFHGPLLLAGELGADRMPGSDAVRAAPAYGSFLPPTDDIPLLVVDKANLDSWLKPLPQTALKFETVKAGVLDGRTRDVSLIPYYLIRHQRMNVYWKLYSAEELAYRRQVVSDEVNPGSETYQRQHHRQGLKDAIAKPAVREDDRLGRVADDGGWFSYVLKINPRQERHYLVVTYWGSEEAGHEFDVVVDDNVLGHENLCNKWPLTYYEEVYELPRELVHGKQQVTVKFAAQPGLDAGAVYGLKITSNPQLFPNYLFYGYVPAKNAPTTAPK